MVAPNLFGFVEGYQAQQSIELRDAEERRRQEAEARQQTEERRRQALFDQQQQEFFAAEQLRQAERDLALQRATGAAELLQVTQPDAVAGARFNLMTNAATREAMTPVVPQVAQAGAQTLLDRALTAQTTAGTARTQSQVLADFLGTPGVTDTLRETQVNAAQTAQSRTALGRLVAEQDLLTAQDPQAQAVVRATQQIAQETKLLDLLLQQNNLGAANQLLQRRGMEIKVAPPGSGAPLLIREVGAQEWRPWEGAMALPFYRQQLANYELAAQAMERRAKAQPAGTAPVTALGLGLTPSATPTPLAGRAPAPAPALTPAPVPPPAPAPQPRLNLDPAQLAALVQYLRQQEAVAATQRYMQAMGR